MEGSPEQWQRRVIDAFYLEMADSIIAGDQGGAMVRSVIHSIDPSVPVQLVYASRGKRTRAEPVSHSARIVNATGGLP
jgi:phage terminase large subunit-like protein